MSARANALAVSSPLAGPALLRRLNGLASELYFTAAAPVPEDFRVRGAVRRTYRYFDVGTSADADRWQGAARLLTGRIDVRSFGRGIPAAHPVYRDVESVTVRSGEGGLRIEVRAPSFVWGMVRKIVAALREHGAGRLSLDQLEGAVRGRTRLTLPLAEPEPLVLWEVEYPLSWAFRWDGPTRYQVARLRSEAAKAWTRARVLDLVASPPD